MRTYDDYWGDFHDSVDGNDDHDDWLSFDDDGVDFDGDNWLLGADDPSAAYMLPGRCCSCGWFDIFPDCLCIQWMMRQIDGSGLTH